MVLYSSLPKKQGTPSTPIGFYTPIFRADVLRGGGRYYCRAMRRVKTVVEIFPTSTRLSLIVNSTLSVVEDIGFEIETRLHPGGGIKADYGTRQWATKLVLQGQNSSCRGRRLHGRVSLINLCLGGHLTRCGKNHTRACAFKSQTPRWGPGRNPHHEPISVSFLIVITSHRHQVRHPTQPRPLCPLSLPVAYIQLWAKEAKRTAGKAHTADRTERGNRRKIVIGSGAFTHLISGHTSQPRTKRHTYTHTLATVRSYPLPIGSLKKAAEIHATPPTARKPSIPSQPSPIFTCISHPPYHGMDRNTKYGMLFELLNFCCWIFGSLIPN